MSDRKARDARYSRSEKGRQRHDRYNRSTKGSKRNWRYDCSPKGRARKLRYAIERTEREGGNPILSKAALAEFEGYLRTGGPNNIRAWLDWLNEVDPLPKLVMPARGRKFYPSDPISPDLALPGTAQQDGSTPGLPSRG